MLRLIKEAWNSFRNPIPLPIVEDEPVDIHPIHLCNECLHAGICEIENTYDSLQVLTETHAQIYECEKYDD